MKKKTIIALILLVIVAAVGGTSYYVYSQNNQSSSSTAKSSTTEDVAKSNLKQGKKNSSSKVASSSSSSTNKSVKSNDDEPMTRKGAVQAAQDLLQAVNEAPDGKSTDQQRIQSLEKDKNNYTKVISEEARNKINLVDFMKTDARGGQLAGEALLNVTHSIKQTGNKKIVAASSDTYNGMVYFDKKNKMATVPVDIFTTSSTNLGMEFIYTDGEWIFQPYSLISEITIRVSDQSSLTNTPEGNASKNSNSDSSSASSSSSSSASSSSSSK